MSRLSSRIQAVQPFHVMGLLRKSKELEREGRDIVHMEIGEPDFPTPSKVVDAGVRAMQSGNIKYTVAAGLPELRTAISEFYKCRQGVQIPAERIFLTPGGSGALLLAFAMLIDSGTQVLMADPCYPCNRNMVRLFDGYSRLIPRSADQNFQLDLESVRSHWGGDTRGVLIASPSNPAGTLIDPNELEAIIRYAGNHDGFVISDEIYHGLEYDETAVSALKYSDEVFVVNSFSKYFGMTGWRIGWLVVPERYIESVEKLAQNLFISAPSHSQFAAIAAFDPENILELERRRVAFRARRDFLLDRLREIGFDIPLQPGGAFYIYADCGRFCENSDELANCLLERYGVAITPGKDFGKYRPERYVRFAYTTSMDRLAEAMDRLRAALKTSGAS